MNWSRLKRSKGYRVIFGTSLVFITALLPRLYASGSFLTIDEAKWAEGAAQFLLALHTGDLSQTYWHFFPGITITWGSALALWGLCLPAPDLAACASLHIENLGESIGWLRLSPVLLTSLGVTGVYVLGRELFGHRLALLTALLLAVDPFFVAHSRILNGDAGAAILMFLSLLAFLRYWREMSASSGANSAQSGLRNPGQSGMNLAQPGLRNPGQNRGFGNSLRAVSALHPSLILSGLMAGLGLLTKLPSPLIVAFVGGLGLIAMILAWRQEGMAALRRWFVALLVWGGIALLVFVALWPTMWVAPLETLRLMYIDAFKFGGIGEGHATFYLGQTVADPGPWFYPYAIAFRLTPVVMLGFLITIGWLFSKITRCAPRPTPYVLHTTHYTTPGQGTPRIPNDPHFVITVVMLAFILFVILFSNASPKKLDRYVMAVVPALVFLAALGFVKVEQWCLRSPAPLPLCHPVLSRALLAGMVALQLLFTILAAPYYLTYYNPLLGSVKRAATQVPVGWGEGLEQAASYLNNLPEAGSLTVSSWYNDIFHPYFVGRQASFSDDGRAQLAADYVVFYINQIQRQKPYPGLVDYFRAKEPAFVVAVKPTGGVTNSVKAEKSNHHVSWVEVYQAPAAQSASGAPKVEGVAQLLAYKVAGSRVASSRVADDIPELPSADQVSVTLFLRVLGPMPAGTTFRVALTNGKLWGNWALTDIKGEWQEGNIVEWHGRLTLPADMPPGEYRLWAAFQFEEGTVITEFPMSDQDPVINVEQTAK